MATKRAAPAAGASAPGTVNSSSTSSKRPCHDHDQTAIEGETADTPIVVKSEDTDSLLQFIPETDITTIYRQYDLTLVVGDQVHPKGIKAFRVSSACLSMAGEVFGSMFSGRYSESNKAEIVFPDDSPDAFLVILRIIHWQHQELPSTFTRDQLLDLAIVCDKYFLHDIVKMTIHSKNWLSVHKNGSPYLPVNADIQDWILIAHQLRFDQDYEYLVNSLAMNLRKSQNLSRPSLYFNNNGKKESLRVNLPDAVLERINKTRTAMLDEIQDACIANLGIALNQKLCNGAKTLRCASAGVGILVRTFHDMGMPIDRSHPAGAPSPLQNSVRSYWKGINLMERKNIFPDHHPPNKRRAPIGRHHTTSTDHCSWNRCMRHLDPKVTVNATLKKYTHNGLEGGWAFSQDLEPGAVTGEASNDISAVMPTCDEDSELDMSDCSI